MRVETMSMRVTSVFSTMDVMSTSVMSLSLEMSVPGALLQTQVEISQSILWHRLSAEIGQASLMAHNYHERATFACGTENTAP